MCMCVFTHTQWPSSHLATTMLTCRAVMYLACCSYNLFVDYAICSDRKICWNCANSTIYSSVFRRPWKRNLKKNTKIRAMDEIGMGDRSKNVDAVSFVPVGVCVYVRPVPLFQAYLCCFL